MCCDSDEINFFSLKGQLENGENTVVGKNKKLNGYYHQ